jgi:hypothetical protein
MPTDGGIRCTSKPARDVFVMLCVAIRPGAGSGTAAAKDGSEIRGRNDGVVEEVLDKLFIGRESRLR